MTVPNLTQRLDDMSEEDLTLLRDRARELAKVAATEDSAERLQLLQVNSRGHQYALPLDVVEGVGELASIATVPSVPTFIRGLVSFRGDVMLAVELGSLLGMSALGFADLRRVICISAGGKKIAVLGERALTVRSALASEFSSDSLAGSSFVQGVDSNFISLLDPAAFIDHVFRALGGSA